MTVRLTTRHSISRALRDMPIQGTADSGDTTSVVDARLIQSETDQLKGMYVTVYEDSAQATNVGEERQCTAYSTGDMTVEAFPAAISSVSKYEGHRIWKFEEYNNAIDNAHDIARKRHLIEHVDESEITDNLLLDGLMSSWDSSTSSNNWTEDANSTFTRESSVKYGRYFSGKLVTDGTNIGSLSQSVAEFPKYAGKAANLYMWIYCATADRLRIRLTDGVNTWNSDYHDGTDGFVKIELLNKTIDESATELTASMQVSAGAAVTAYLGRADLRCPGKDSLSSQVGYYYTGDVSANFISLSQVELETGIHNVFNPLSNYDWSIVGAEGDRQLYIPNAPSGRAIRVVGQRSAVKPTADTSSLELKDAFVESWAIMVLLRRKPSLDTTDERLLSYSTQQAFMLLDHFTKRYHANSVMVD